MESILDTDSRIFNSRSTFGQQLMALIQRNILIKRRNRSRTLLELLFPIYLILITIAIKSSTKPTTSAAIPQPEGQGTNWFVTSVKHKQDIVFPDFRTTVWFIVSQNSSFSNQIKTNIFDVLNDTRYPDYDTIDFNTDFNSSDEIERHYLSNDKNISLALIFDTNNSSNISYTIRMPFKSVPNQLNSVGSLGECRTFPFESGCDQMKYFGSGFAFIQTVVDSALIQFLNPSVLTMDCLIPAANLSVFPMPQFTSNLVKWQSFMPTYLSWCFMPSVSILTVMFVLEKERKIKEGMLMMGLRMSAYWLSWIIVQTILILVSSLVMALILYFAAIIENTNPIILFILISLFGVSTIGISALISPFFKKEKAAGSVVSFITMIAGCVHLLVVYLDVSPSVYYLLSLVSPVAFTLGLNQIALEVNRDITFNNLFEGQNFSVGSAIVMLVVDSILYSLIAVYLDQVIPGEYGPKQSIFFFLKKSFWFPNKSIVPMARIKRNDSNYEHNPDVEEIADDMKGKAVISIENLSKIYGKGKKCVKAVNNLSFTIYESQITGLLGHNGAGKSTLINMLVGNIAPTSGTAYIYGHNITEANEMNSLRQIFGVCLQQDILFDELNSMEHLNFFAQIKGVPKISLNSEVKKLLSEVQLSVGDRTTPSKKLSGGQKRKLCVAIALIGNPKIILLDEPSSGVDPYSRRQLWSLLQSYKKDRIIILSTHFMDEADLLADRKAIIANGKLRCVGSSLFLKNRFGIGYHLTVDIKKGTDVDSVNTLIQSSIESAQIERFTASEIYFILPPSETQLFPKLFDTLEQNICEVNSPIKSFGISMTTLEEVFLKIGDEVEAEEQTNFTAQYWTNDATPKVYEELNIDNKDLSPNFWQTFKAFLYIRFLIFIRNPMHTIPIIVLPIIMIIISYFLMKSSNLKNMKPLPLLLNPDIYSESAKLLYKNTSLGVFVSIVENLGVKAQSINNFDIKSMANSFMAVDVKSFNSTIDWDFLFNNTYYHSLPILQNLMTNVFKNFRNPIAGETPIHTYNHPFPQTNDEMIEFSIDGKVYTYVILMAVMLGSIPPTIAVEVVEDRESKIKNLLRVCGLGFRGYWITTLVCHLTMFLISVLLILIVTIFIVKVEFLQDPEAIGCIFILFFLFMPTSLLTCYVMTHMFNKKDTARSVLPLICYIPGMFLVIIVAAFIGIDPKVAKLLHIIFCFVWPFYAPQGALLWMATTSNVIKISALINGDNPRISYYDWDQNITICFVALSLHLVLFSVLLVIVDRLKSGETFMTAFGLQNSETTKVSKASDLEDDDVRQERNDVQNYLNRESPEKTPIALLNNLHKNYYKNNGINVFKRNASESEKIAVQNVSLLLESGNIFGLLGPNGAGKTTTMKIMIREEKQTEGTVLISGHEVKFSDTDIFKLIGYCPQEDTLWKEITLIEHLRLYASIRGVPPPRIEALCQNYVESLRLEEHSHKKTQQLSGGTKRKLCYLLALLGRPKLVLLDEPSTGMDPRAKRFLWKTILSAFERNSNRSAVLTTHSMEEADALCTRLAIMIKGVMRCIGSVQHLKNKYGAGYLLEIKFNNQTNDEINRSKLKESIKNYFTTIMIKEEYKNRLIFDIPQQSVDSISRIFSFLENLKKTMLSIEEYSFSQKTIEQVFIDFAKQQEINE